MKRCCQKCNLFWNCEEKWYRGERNEVSYCCALCQLYFECHPTPLHLKDKERQQKSNSSQNNPSKM